MQRPCTKIAKQPHPRSETIGLHCTAQGRQGDKSAYANSRQNMRTFRCSTSLKPS